MEGKQPFGDCASICATAPALLIAASCGGSPEPVSEASAPAASEKTVPQSLATGGAKSVMTFFVTSLGPAEGGDLGGLAGADAHCQALAKAEGAGDHTWRAYLSASGAGGQPAINARAGHSGAGLFYCYGID